MKTTKQHGLWVSQNSKRSTSIYQLLVRGVSRLSTVNQACPKRDNKILPISIISIFFDTTADWARSGTTRSQTLPILCCFLKMVESSSSAPATRYSALEDFMRTKETAKEKCRQCRRAACCHGNSPSKVNGEYLEAVTSTSVANGRSPTKR